MVNALSARWSRLPQPASLLEICDCQSTELPHENLFVALPEPRDEGEALAIRHWQYFVKRVRGEGD